MDKTDPVQIDNTSYKCPVCNKKTPRDLVVYLDHTNRHIVEEIKKDHPNWVSGDGTCKRCLEYYKRQITGELNDINIGPKEIRKRLYFGITLLVLSAVCALGLILEGFPMMWYALFFFPLWLAITSIAEARMRTCSLLAEMGMRNMDSGNKKIAKDEVSFALKKRGRRIMIHSALGALALTAAAALLAVSL